MKKDLYTHRLAASIVDIFEDLLDKYNITVPSPEDDERTEFNTSRLYGTVYGDLMDDVEATIIDYLKDSQNGVTVVAWRF